MKLNLAFALECLPSVSSQVRTRHRYLSICFSPFAASTDILLYHSRPATLLTHLPLMLPFTYDTSTERDPH